MCRRWRQIGACDAPEESSQESVLPDNSTQASTPGLQVAVEVAIHAINAAESVDVVRLGVVLTLSKSDDEAFLRRVAGVIAHQLLLTQHLFALASTGPDQNTLILTGSPPTDVQRALLLVSAALPTRISSSYTAPDGSLFTARVQYIAPADEPTLLRALRQAVALDTRAPPPGSRGVDQLLAEAPGAFGAVRAGASQARSSSTATTSNGLLLPGSLRCLVGIGPRRGRCALPSSPHRRRPKAAPASAPKSPLQEALAAEAAVEEDARREQRLLLSSSFVFRSILVSADGRAFSLAAPSPRQLGLCNATDMVGGWAAWVHEFGADGELHVGEFK
ncbi:hypothetical protein DFH09DRAFT_1355688 [Mycena vulgaris]|nr:hypothetical protein DFH09DRAFT_1355688 [Mycena vulgaris]